ncbi:hypothetical protein AC579_3149 [Pseudocercospora musae]|uniref:Pru domain-containing protein n=1 Tax=Pseudocercospora musae TaxID=113226 RepID=A0A139IE39_9PEZI|nr:hypothetical protein AC579_3149 [Pseudocercospora musae]
MAATPLITFKAGKCNFTGRKVKPDPTPGYIYLYEEDELLHFCWRPRSAPATEPELDLIMFPQDGHFYPLLKEQGAEELHSPTTGRIFVLRFTSSSQKHFFWMQSKPQSREGHLSWFSQRDQRIGQIIDALLQGEGIDVEREIQDIRNGDDSAGPNGDADAMEIDQGGSSLERQETGGAGADATGGDPREEGEASREGGADGGRAASLGVQDTNAIVQNFLNSLKGSGGSASQQSQRQDKPFTTLPDLLPSSTTTAYLSSASPQQIDHLCTYLPPELFLLAQESEKSTSDTEPSPATAQAAIEALSTAQKKDILTRVLRSPQFHQSLGSLTVALRDGGLPMIGEALQVKVENGGLIHGGSVPLGGDDAVEAFVKGVKKTAEEEEKKR